MQYRSSIQYSAGRFWLVMALIAATILPTSASAQFVPKGEVASLGSVAEQEDLQTVLDALAKKNDTARKKVLVTLGQLEEKKIGATNARRQIDSVTGSLKVELNKILADYARQTPPTASVREAYRVAQTYLNDIRAMTEDAATEAAIEKKLDPEAPTGKYLDYQKKIQALATKALEKADERLKERGKKDTVRRDLEQIVKDTERQIELATTSYLLEHTELLESALRRINTKVLEGLASDMEARFKAANERSSDKENDLNDEENETFQTVKQEMTDIVDRTTTTIDSLIRQVLQANLPTTSQEPGVNPLLEAKFKTQKQMADILQTAQDRIGKITARASQNPEYSALLKEVITREATRQKQRLQDTYNEYEGNFIAGDPTKQQYNKRKDRAQDEAKGCDSFLCDIGRVVSGVGSAFISGSTGGLVNIPPQTFSKGLFGIKDPSYAASPYSSSYFNGTPSLPYVNGRYVAPGAFGNMSVGIDQRCLVLSDNRKLVFVESALAQEEKSPEEQALEEDMKQAEADRAAGLAQPGTTLYIAPNGDVYVNTVDSRSQFSSKNYGKVSTVPGFTAAQVEEAKRKAGISTGSTVTTKPSTNTSSSIIDQFKSRVQQGFAIQLGSIGIGTPGFNPNIGLLNCPPGTPGYYRAAGGVLSTGLGGVMGGLPVAQTLYGSGTTNDQLRLQLNQANVAAQLAQGFQILAGIAPEDKKAGYVEVAEAFATGQLDVNKIVTITEKLKSLEFYKLQRQGGDTLAEMFYNLCSYSISGSNSMISFCKGLLVLNNGVDLGTGTAVSDTDKAKSAAALAEERKSYLNTIRAEGIRVNHVNQLVSTSEKCSQFERILGGSNSVESSIKEKQADALDLGTDEEALELIRKVEAEIAQYQEFYDKNCKDKLPSTNDVSKVTVADTKLKLESDVYEKAKATGTLCMSNLGTVKEVKENLTVLKKEIDSLVTSAQGSDRIAAADLQKRVNAALAEVSSYIANCEKVVEQASQQAPGVSDGTLQVSVAGNAKYSVYEVSAFITGLAATPELESRLIPRIPINRGRSYSVGAPSGKYKLFFYRVGLKTLKERQENTRSATGTIEVAPGKRTCVVIYDSSVTAKVEPCTTK